MVELSGLDVRHQDGELTGRHLHSLPEIVGQDDPAGVIGLVVDEQFGAAAAAVTAEDCDGFETVGAPAFGTRANRHNPSGNDLHVFLSAT